MDGKYINTDVGLQFTPCTLLCVSVCGGLRGVKGEVLWWHEQMDEE